MPQLKRKAQQTIFQRLGVPRPTSGSERSAFEELVRHFIQFPLELSEDGVRVLQELVSEVAMNHLLQQASSSRAGKRSRKATTTASTDATTATTASSSSTTTVASDGSASAENAELQSAAAKKKAKRQRQKQRKALERAASIHPNDAAAAPAPVGGADLTVSEASISSRGTELTLSEELVMPNGTASTSSSASSCASSADGSSRSSSPLQLDDAPPVRQPADTPDELYDDEEDAEVEAFRQRLEQLSKVRTRCCIIARQPQPRPLLTP